VLQDLIELFAQKSILDLLDEDNFPLPITDVEVRIVIDNTCYFIIGDPVSIVIPYGAFKQDDYDLIGHYSDIDLEVGDLVVKPNNESVILEYESIISPHLFINKQELYKHMCAVARDRSRLITHAEALIPMSNSPLNLDNLDPDAN
jgi:hypothetical protein